MAEAVMPDIPPRMVRRYMDYFIGSMVVWCIFSAAVNGPMFSGLLNVLELTPPQIGFIMSIWSLCLPLQLIGSLVQQKYFRRKTFWAVSRVIHYSSYLLLALLTAMWTGIPTSTAVTLFVVIFFIVNGTAQLTGAIENAWMGEVIPPRESTAFWNRRNGFAMFAGIVAGLIAGKCADLLGRDQRSTYVIMLSGGVVFGYASMFAMLAMRDRDTSHDLKGSMLGQIRDVVQNKPFRQIVGFWVCQHIGTCLLNSFYFLYLLRDMKMSMFCVQTLAVCSSLVGLAGAFFFRIVGHRYGNKPVLILCTVMKVFEFILTALWLPDFHLFDDFGNGLLRGLGNLTGLPVPTVPEGVFTVLPAMIVAGFFNVGLAASQMALITSTGPREQRSTSIAIFYAVLGVFGFATMTLSGFAYKYFGMLDWVREAGMTPYTLLALCSALVFALSIFIIARYREDGAAATGTLVRTIFSGNPIRTVYQAHALSQPIGEVSRITKLRRIHSTLISDEVLHGLYSPSSRVRDSALLNISTMEEKASANIVDELIRLLDLPELGLQAMAARTLGRLREKKALPRLIAHFRDNDLALAQACIFAAGLIGEVEAESELRNILSDMRFHGRWPHAAEALSRLGTGDFRYTKDIFKVLANESFWVLRQQTLISLARLMMHDKNAAYVVFDAETRNSGQEIERLLKQISLHPVWKHCLPDEKADFEALINDYDKGDYIGCIHRLLPLELELYGIRPEDPAMTPAEFLSMRFAAGGMREKGLEAPTYAANNLWLQLKLWAELRYDTDGTDRFLLLSVLIAAAELLPRRLRDNGRPDGG